MILWCAFSHCPFPILHPTWTCQDSQWHSCAYARDVGHPPSFDQRFLQLVPMQISVAYHYSTCGKETYKSNTATLLVWVSLYHWRHWSGGGLRRMSCWWVAMRRDVESCDELWAMMLKICDFVIGFIEVMGCVWRYHRIPQGLLKKYASKLMCIQVHSNLFEPITSFFRPDESEIAGENQVSLEVSWRELSSNVHTKF